MAWSEAGSDGERAVGGDLALGRVDAELRADGDRTDAVALRDEVALHLHVLQTSVYEPW